MRDPARELELQRRQMVKALARQGIRDRRVLRALEQVPRHRFTETMTEQSYSDHALPIGGGQTISRPYVVARMTELLEIEPRHRVLEIGTGSGYQTAILAQLAQWVFSLERISGLAQRAIRRMRELEIENVKIQCFDGSVGWSEMAPFDRIMVTAGAPKVPEPLLDQLRLGGRLLIPEGDRQSQQLVLYTHEKAGTFVREEIEPASFVPLVGRYGWRREEA